MPRATWPRPRGGSSPSQPGSRPSVTRADRARATAASRGSTSILKDDPLRRVGAGHRAQAARPRSTTSRPGVTALVGGGTAIQYDYDQASARDIKMIVPLALVVIAADPGDPAAGDRRPAGADRVA